MRLKWATGIQLPPPPTKPQAEMTHQGDTQLHKSLGLVLNRCYIQGKDECPAFSEYVKKEEIPSRPPSPPSGAVKCPGWSVIVATTTWSCAQSHHQKPLSSWDHFHFIHYGVEYWHLAWLQFFTLKFCVRNTFTWLKIQTVQNSPVPTIPATQSSFPEDAASTYLSRDSLYVEM